MDSQAHPESQRQGARKKRQAQVKAQSMEEQNQSEYDENFE